MQKKYTDKCVVREQPNKRGLEFVVKVQNTEILFKKFSLYTTMCAFTWLYLNMGEIKTVEDVKFYAFYQLSMDRDKMIGPYICDVIFTMIFFWQEKP